MKFLPASLTTRTLLLIVAVVTIAEITTFSLFLQYRRGAHSLRTAQVIGSQIHLLQAILPSLDEAMRQKLTTADEGEQWLKLRPDDDSVPKHEPSFGFARRLAASLKQILGEEVKFRHEGPGHFSGIWIGFSAGAENWWLLLPQLRFAPQELPSNLWLRLAVALAFLAVIAVLFVRGIVGSLARLGEAVIAAGTGSARAVVPEGPKEVQLLAERYNIMIQQLADAESERREMLAGLTHDLRAPLARLRVRLALLENDAERAGLSRDADDMERIVNQCLGFLQSETINQGAAPALPFADAVSNEIARCHEMGRAVSMRVSENAMASPVAISPGDLQRLLDNLIDNAFQHGQPPVDIFLHAKDAGFVTLEVSDHGQGITAEKRARALEAFAQLNPARASSGHCGLGLATVRRIMSACNGEIELTDTEDGGLTVILKFPVVDIEPAA
ncbi:MAG: hypothetical protein LBD67_04050 [Candidatus Accumulibacter sp.]|jgi:two-component system osmolarity sensor histidine kinase EnvZ|nr:hypothetical protein [Accumulibacter sp.]